MIVFFIVVFFGADPVGVLLSDEYSTIEECLKVAVPIAIVAPKAAPARGYCVAKSVKVRA